MTLEETGQAILDFFSNTFGLPAEWFGNGALLVFYFILPLVGLIFMWYTFLYKKLGILRSSKGASAAVAVLIALMSSFLIGLLSPTLTLAVAIGLGVLLWGRFSWKRIILAFLIAWALTFFYPMLTNFVAPS